MMEGQRNQEQERLLYFVRNIYDVLLRVEDRLMEKKLRARQKMEWTALATVLERLLLLIFTVVSLIVTITLMTVEAPLATPEEVESASY